VTLVMAFAVQTVSSVLERLVPGTGEGLQAIAALISNVLGWGVLAGALALLFRYLPAADLTWRPVLIASIATSALLVVGTALIAWYLRTVGASSVGGVASTPIAILVWIYYEAQILLAGVHLSRLLSER
jgi:membrane protein